MSVWSKLQKSSYLIISDKVDFQIHFSIYRMNSKRGCTDLPRYWITIGNKKIFDYSNRLVDTNEIINYSYETQVPAISDCIREYIDCPVN